MTLVWSLGLVLRGFKASRVYLRNKCYFHLSLNLNQNHAHIFTQFFHQLWWNLIADPPDFEGKIRFFREKKVISNFWLTTKNRVGGNRDVWSYHDWITIKITIFHWNLRMFLIPPRPTESHQLVHIHQVHPFCLARSRGWFSCVRISRKWLWKRKKSQKPRNKRT